jgi:hypothetical protein
MKHGVLHGTLPPRTTAPLERSAIVGALASNQGNVSKAAHTLGAARRTLQKRMRDYGIPVGRSGRPREALPYRGRGGDTFGKLLVGAALITGGYYLGKWLVQKYREHEKEKQKGEQS